MPAEIPGYYFDTSKNKYFRIQPNHIAPSGSKYAHEAVNAEKKADIETKRHESRRQTQRQQLITRAQLLQHPSLSPLKRRLGDLSTSASQLAAEEYASSLTSSLLFHGTTSGHKFAIDPTTKALYALSKPLPGRHPEFSIFHYCPFTTGPYIYSYLDSPTTCTPVFDSPDLLCVAPLTPEYIIWASSIGVPNYRSHHNDTSSAIHFSRKFPPSDVAWNRADFGDYGTVRTVPDTRIWDISISPARDSWAVASGRGLVLYPSLGKGIREGGMWTQTTQVSAPGIPKKEMMCVEFKDPNVFMCGARSGKIWFGDRRGGSAMRLRHASAVANLKAMRNENCVLVNGLEQMSIYDLRYTPSQHSSTTSTSTSHPRHRQRIRPSPLSIPPQSRSNTPKPPSHNTSTVAAITKPLLTFPLPTTQSSTYGLGFSYEAVLNLIARSTTDFRGDNHVTLWSANTGKMIKSPINEYRFEGEGVTCIDFVDFDNRTGGEGGAGKSLVTLAGGRVLEWKP